MKYLKFWKFTYCGLTGIPQMLSICTVHYIVHLIFLRVLKDWRRLEDFYYIGTNKNISIWYIILCSSCECNISKELQTWIPEPCQHTPLCLWYIVWVFSFIKTSESTKKATDIEVYFKWYNICSGVDILHVTKYITYNKWAICSRTAWYYIHLRYAK